jgi:hypothetical protein
MVRRALFGSPVHRRLPPLTMASFTGGVLLWVPVEKLFLAELGFTPQTIGVMAAAYAAVVPVLEIPRASWPTAGAAGGVLLIGDAGMFASVLVGGLSTNVATYLVAALLLGVYFAMQSGTFDAIVYDTVVEETGGSEGFEAILGRVRMIESASLVLGALGGGALAALTSPRATYFVTLPFVLVSTACLIAFREPRLHHTGETRSLRQHVAVTLGVLGHDRRLLPVAALLVLKSILTQAVFEFGPLWLVDADAGAAAFGPSWAGLMASLGLGGVLAGRLRLDSSRGVLGFGAVLVGTAATLLVGTNVVVVTIVQVVAAATTVIIGIHLTRVLHDAVPSEVRSGVASGVGAATWEIFLPFAVGFGAVSQHFGIHAAGWLLVVLAVGIAGLLHLTRRANAATAEFVASPVSAQLTSVATAA